MVGQRSLEEVISFQRRRALAGVEVMVARNTSRNWRVFNVDFALAVPSTWHVEAFYRHKREAVVPGMVFCTDRSSSMPRTGA
jgi:hypothetical protein